MAFFTLSDGGRVRYEIIGSGVPIVVTPGGTAGLDELWPMAHELSRHYQVLLWDRRNTGRSDICFDGPSEGQMWRQDLAELVQGLGLGPLHVLGGSGGSRMSLFFAIGHPELVRKLVVWNAVGGWFAGAILAGGRYTPMIRAAWIGGMEAVAEVPQMAELIADNPRNRELLLAWDPMDFIARMKEWARFYLPEGDKILTGGMTEEQLSGLPMKTLIFQGGDDSHPPELSEEYHRLIPDSRLIAPARWDSHDWWSLWTKNEHFAVWRELVPEIVEFLQED
ncbi:MAG TPA: alpha/beta hydrolase [Baekduia sp.]|uniref:alpha/beta fold hydrolase n=1 Tax=Baekduia sp. TaxID=2600305 RepID=UPI002D76575E|nr:alpha/beta hydrolase [Baekduia sp.]HET6509937.1 alpha/beta hydrolase [Baekduia sp.]